MKYFEIHTLHKYSVHQTICQSYYYYYIIRKLIPSQGSESRPSEWGEPCACDQDTSGQRREHGDGGVGRQPHPLLAQPLYGLRSNCRSCLVAE